MIRRGVLELIFFDLPSFFFLFSCFLFFYFFFLLCCGVFSFLFSFAFPFLPFPGETGLVSQESGPRMGRTRVGKYRYQNSGENSEDNESTSDGTPGG